MEMMSQDVRIRIMREFVIYHVTLMIVLLLFFTFGIYDDVSTMCTRIVDECD